MVTGTRLRCVYTNIRDCDTGALETPKSSTSGSNTPQASRLKREHATDRNQSDPDGTLWADKFIKGGFMGDFWTSFLTTLLINIGIVYLLYRWWPWKGKQLGNKDYTKNIFVMDWEEGSMKPEKKKKDKKEEEDDEEPDEIV